MSSTSSPVVVGTVSVYCSVHPNPNRTENPSYAFIVHDTTEGTVSGVIPLSDRPDVDYVWALLQRWGLSKEEAVQVTDAFQVPQSGRLDDRMYGTPSQEEPRSPAFLNTYLILYVDGSSQELEAEFYQGDGGDSVFIAAQQEVLRVPIKDVASISKAK
jgi:hypothetical protein